MVVPVARSARIGATPPARPRPSSTELMALGSPIARSASEAGERRRKRARVSDDDKEGARRRRRRSTEKREATPLLIPGRTGGGIYIPPSQDEEGSDEEEDKESDEEQVQIRDLNLVNQRRAIYLTIMSTVDFEEAGHKLMKIKMEPGQEKELCLMLLECCKQEKMYRRYYGLLGQRFCMMNKVYQENFETCFMQQYSAVHRLETNQLRNVANFFAHLLGTDALPWHVLAYIRLTEEDTTSSSRIFVKILFQELSEHLGVRVLNERLNDPTMQGSFDDSIFPKDHPKNTRFSINFFTSIGLGALTESLRQYLKDMPRFVKQ